MANKQITKALLVEAIVSAIPYPTQIHDLDLTSEDDAIRFTWRSGRFRCSLNYLSVEQVEDGCLAGSDIAIIVGQLIKLSVTRKLDQLVAQ